ncbi:MAG: hypothetical protein KDD94_12815, partial [Calditrichaeota bacterium]|nr:hypothetical protein [Calditrichota bacterium]
LFSLLILIGNPDNNSPDKTKVYNASIAATASSRLLADLPNGSEVIITKSADQQIHATVSIKFRDQEAEEGLRRLPEKIDLLVERGRSIVLDLTEVKRALMVEESDGFFDRIFSAISSGKRQYYSENGVRYIIISHYMKVEIQVPQLAEFELNNKYGIVDFRKIAVTEMIARAHSSEVSGSDLSGSLDLSDKYSRASLENINGSLRLDCHEMDIDVTNVSGPASIDNKYKPTRVTKIGGKLSLSLHNSTTEVDDVNGDLKIQNKYSSTKVNNIKGNLLADLHEVEFTAENISGYAEVNDKYKPVAIRNVGKYASLDLHQCRLTLSDIGATVNIKNKYDSNEISRINGDLIIDAHESSFKIKRVNGNLTMSNKYKPVEIQSVRGFAKLTLQNSTLKLDSVGSEVIVSNKYNNNTITRVFANVDLTSHESNNTIENVSGSLSLNAKYGSGSIKNVSGDVTIKAHQHPLDIESIGNLILDGKYTSVDLTGNLKSIEIDNHEATINIKVPRSYNSDIRINNKYGDIRIDDLNLELYRINAMTKSGRIRSKLMDDDYDSRSNTDRLRRNWSDKTKPALDLENNSGDIILN